MPAPSGLASFFIWCYGAMTVSVILYLVSGVNSELIVYHQAKHNEEATSPISIYTLLTT